MVHTSMITPALLCGNVVAMQGMLSALLLCPSVAEHLSLRDDSQRYCIHIYVCARHCADPRVRPALTV